VGDEAADKVATLLEQLSSRFELVVEVAEGFGGKIQALHEEMVSQFSEVGKQIRFLSDQIGENRARLMAARSDLAAEIVRLNEALGATRVQIREDLAGIGAAQPAATSAAGEELVRRMEEAQSRLSAEMDQHAVQLQSEVSRLLSEFSTRGVEGAAAAGAEGLAAEVRNEVKATHKALTTLAKKFERFDDKMTVQVKDHDQRLRKLERQARG